MAAKLAIDKPYSTGKEIETDLRDESRRHGVRRSNIIADSDGLGQYLDSVFEGIKTFHGGAPAPDNTYFNLKSQCAFKLAEVINAGRSASTARKNCNRPLPKSWKPALSPATSTPTRARNGSSTNER